MNLLDTEMACGARGREPWPPESQALIARVAGLEIRRILPFSSPACAAALERMEALEAELGRERQELARRLYDAVPNHEADPRRALLKARRDSHNGRSLERYRGSRHWSSLVAASGGQVEEVLALEARLTLLKSELEKLHRQEFQREETELLRLAEQPGFLAGLSFASPDLKARLDRRSERGRSTSRRKERKLAQSLLRYASRAALKLSPNSTLTPVGVARRVEADGGAFPRFRGTEAPAGRSKLRYSRSRLEQLGVALLAMPEVQERVPVRLNPSCQLISRDVLLYIRAARWELDPAQPEITFRASALRRVRVDRPALAWCLKRPIDQPVRLEQLEAELLGDAVALRLPAGEAACALEQLLDLGILEWLPPWRQPGAQLEAEMVRLLDQLPQKPWVEEARGCLRGLVALGQGPRATPREEWGRRASALAERAWRSIPSTGDHRPAASSGLELFEDVILAPAEGRAGDPVVEVPREPLEKALGAVRPWAELGGLCGSRLDFTLTVTSYLRSCCRGRGRISVLEAFQLALPLFREHRRHSARPGGPAGWTSSFDPLDTPAVQELHALKSDLWKSLLELSDGAESAAHGPGLALRGRDLEALAARIPETYRPRLGPCLQLQAADARAETFVLNRFFEGSGRYSSRFAPLMEPSARDSWVGRLVAGSSFEESGETLHLLDLMCSQGSALNARHVQTRHVLLVPGEGFSLPSPVGVQLRDLSLDLESEGPVCRLVDRENRRYLPAHLGGSAVQMMPALVQFLALWGPGEIASPLPPVRARRLEGAVFQPRLTLGNVVMGRARWTLSDDSLAQELESLRGGEALAAVSRLRRRLGGLPERVFVAEKISGRVPGGMFKPQYLDLTSPHFVELLRHILKAQPRLSFEEALPDFAGPDRACGDARAMEIQIDTAGASAPRESLAVPALHL
ncbi:MAG: lantibiotic dehydratase [Acidobacteriota bacterium]